MSDIRWPGSVVMITGASSGLGTGFAQQLAARGAELVLVARSADKLEELATSLRAAHKCVVHVLPADLSVPGESKRVVETLNEKKIVVDHLINNAGVGRARAVARDDPALLTNMIEVNCTALIDLTVRLLPTMIARRTGGVLQVASVVGFSPCPYQSTYAATKAFVKSFTEGLAIELEGSDVRTSALCPGHVRTGFQVAAGFSSNAMAVPGELSIERTVFVGLRGYERGRTVVVPGFMNNLSTIFGSLLPRSWVARIGASMLKKLGRFD